jgi:hypothetical protein
VTLTESLVQMTHRDPSVGCSLHNHLPHLSFKNIRSMELIFKFVPLPYRRTQ